MADVAAKGPHAYRSISEAAAELGLAPHVLRFWETRFAFIRPMTRSGGRRFYRPEDIAVLRCVRVLLHEQGRAIKDVQRLHREGGVARMAATAAEGAAAEVAASRPAGLTPGARTRLGEVLADLQRVRAEVERLLAAPRRES